MAIIYSYPEKITPAGGDFLVITDSEQTAPNKNRTKSLTVDNLANYVVTSTSGITGSGTLNTIAMFTPTGSKIGDSFITQTASPDTVNVSARFNVSPGGVNAFNVSQTGGTTGAVTIPGSLKVVGTYYDAAGDEGTDGDVLVAKGTPGNMVTRWVSKADTGIVTGSGTLNTISMFTPDGQSVGDSQLQQSTQLSNGLYQMRFNNADRFIINKPSSVTSGDPEYLIQQDGNFKVSFGWDDDGGGFGYIYNWAGNGLRLGAAGQNPQLELDTAAPKIISHTDHEFEQGILDRNGSSGINGQVLTVSGSSKIEWTNIADISGSVTGSGTSYTLPVWTDGPNGVLGDSMIVQNNSGTIASVTGRLAVDTDLAVNGYARFIGQVQDGTNSPGTNGQVLTSTVTGVEWDDATDVVSGAVAKLIPFQITASAGGSSTYSADNNIVEIGWTGGNGTYILNIPSAATIPYRNIRFVTNSTFPNGASDKVQITAQAGETIDGAAFFEISKIYEGVSLWSNGTEWIIIQAKAH